VAIWDPVTLCLGRISDHNAAVTRVAFRGDGALATGSMDGAVRLYTADGAPMAVLPDHEVLACWRD